MSLAAMAQSADRNTDRLLQRPLYVFDLPEEILYTLQVKLENTIAPTEESLPQGIESQSRIAADSQDESPRTATSCALCNLSFADLQEQRRHVRSDLHGYNLKQKLKGGKPVSEVEFDKLVGELDESISGSDTSDSEDDEENELGSRNKDTTLSALLKRQAKLADGGAGDAPTGKPRRGAGRPPLIWFSTPKLPSNVSLGIYRAIFSADQQADETHLVETIQRKQLAAKPQAPSKKSDREEGGVPLPPSMQPSQNPASGPNYFLCMIGGGHFAAMLVSLAPKLVKKAGVEDRSATVIAHKTFHRYTTRRKQGGSQSANDNSKGNAHSAGSSLRRYNEAALEKDVRDLLAEWKAWIDSAQLLFIRATGQTNRRTLFGPYEGQVLSHRDDRIRGFPFSTRRATQSELMRAFVELTRVKVSTIDEAALAKQAHEAAAAAEKAKADTNGKAAAPKPAKPSKEDEEAMLHTTQLQALIRRSKAPGMLSYIQSNKLSPDFKFFPADQNHHAPTLLHLAAASNSAACTASLLAKAGADPTVRNDEGKSAFEIAGDRATRDAFRLARSQLGEAKWQWDSAGIPPAITQGEVDARATREKEEKAADEAAEKKRRAADLERLRQEDADKLNNKREEKFGKGRLMTEQKMTAEERRMEQAKGMTDEMRMRLEREKRARAAEERMKRLQGK